MGSHPAVLEGEPLALTAAGLVVLLAAVPAFSAGEFLKNMRKAQKRKDLPERLEYFTRAIRAWTPEDGSTLLADCHYRRGETLARFDHLEEAEPDLSRAVELDPLNLPARLLRGRLRLLLGKPAAAAADLRAAAAAGESVEAWVLLGTALASCGDPHSALAAYARAAKDAPQDHRPALGRARLRLDREDWRGALEELAVAEALSRRDPEVYAAAAEAEAALGRHERALERYDEAVALYQPRVHEAERGTLDPLEARLLRERAATAYFGRGRVHEFLLRGDEALPDYEEACRLGRAQACARAEALKLPQPKSRASRRGEAEKAKPLPEETERPRKRRRPRTPANDAGDRIYAN